MTPYYEQAGITIYHGDCREVLPSLQQCDAVVTDPPYGLDIAEWDRECPYEILRELLRKTTGPVLWFGAAPRLTSDISAFPVQPQRVLIWAPSFTLSHTSADGVYYRWHPIYVWQLQRRHDGPSFDALMIPCDGHNEWFHPATKPIALIQSLIGFCEPSGLVLDPFMGSGTTLVAAQLTQRRAIGIEIEERYCEIAVKRLQRGVRPLLDIMLQQEVLPLEEMTA